jgi:TolA-binding protein
MLPLVGGEAGEEYTAQDATSEVARLRARIEDLQRQLGRLEGRLELTERTESTLREDLERERRQSLEEVQRERAERLEAQKTAKALERDRIRLEWERFYREARQKELEDALEAERSKERSKGFYTTVLTR